MFKRMIELKATVKKWGNSLGILLPKKAGIKENQEIIVHIAAAKKVTKVKDIFGAMRLKKPVAQLMQEIDEELG